MNHSRNAGEPSQQKRSFSPLDAGQDGRKRTIGAVNEIDIQDSLAPRTEREEKSLTERTKTTNKDEKVTNNTAYQDSLDSFTPQS